MNRRSFVKVVSAGTLGTAIFGSRTEKARGSEKSLLVPSDQIRLGIIGAGSRGQELMRHFLRVPGVHITGLCDIYEPRFAAARKITGEETPIYRDHRRLLESRDLDAIVVATPLSLHSDHVVASLQSGRHVYGEKSLGLTLGHCRKIVEPVQQSCKAFQYGHQYP